MWTLSLASLCSLLLLLCTVDLVSSTVILTQNVTNDAEDFTVFPGITIQLTCEANDSFVRWRLSDGTSSIVNNIADSSSVGDFSLRVLSVNSSYILSTATAVSSTNTSLTCSSTDGSDTINVFIKPVVPQIDLVQNVTDDSSNITICPQTPITFTCQSTTGIVIWSLDNGSNTSLSILGETKTLGGFQLSVTNVTILLLLVESTAVISNTASDFTIACHTAITGGLGSSITVSVRGPPAQVSSLQLVEVCYGSISFNWTDNINSLDTPQLDYYYIVSITPPTSGSTYIINDGFNTSITGLRSNQQYTVSVVPLNCAGPGLARVIQQTITTKVPPVPILSELIADTSNNSFATITVSWESGDFTDCLQSPISYYVIIVSGVLRTELIVDGVMTNMTLTVPSCGVSAVTVSARNEAGTSDRSDPIVFTGSSLTLFVSTTAVDGDSVTLSVTISQCLRSLVDNVTVTYRNEPTFGYVKTASYPNNSDSVSIALTDLQSTTQYNASVIVYYRESGRVSVLGPYPITFETTQSFFSFQEAVIIGLSVGFAVSLIIMAILVVVVFVFCHRLKQQRKKGRKLLQKFRNIAMMLRETEQNVKDLRENQMRVRPQTVGKPQENIDYQRNKETMETITVTNSNYEQVTAC